jgi:type IV pilus assembly protein PilN
MTKPELSVIEAKAGDNSLPYEFLLTVMLANPNAPKDEDGDGVPDAPDPASTEAEASATPAAAPPAAGAPAADGAVPPASEADPPAPAASGVSEPAANEDGQGTDPASPASDDGGPGK